MLILLVRIRHCSHLLLCVELTRRQNRLVRMAFQESIRALAVHAIGVAKGGCRLHLLHTHLKLLGVNFALILQHSAQVSKGSSVTPVHVGCDLGVTLERYKAAFCTGA